MKPPQICEVLSSERRHDGFHKVDYLSVRHQGFDGTVNAPVSREVVRRGEIAVIVPYDPIRDVVVLTRQWRIGAFAAKDLPHCPEDLSPWVLETPAGYVDAGETPLKAARRELMEETELEAKHLEQIGRVVTNPGISDEIAFLFYAEVNASNSTYQSGHEGEGEDILVTCVPAEEAFALMDRWEIQKATSLLALNWLRGNRPRLTGSGTARI